MPTTPFVEELGIQVSREFVNGNMATTSLLILSMSFPGEGLGLNKYSNCSTDTLNDYRRGNSSAVVFCILTFWPMSLIPISNLMAIDQELRNRRH